MNVSHEMWTMCAVNRLKFDTFYRQLLFLRQGKGRGGRREGAGKREEGGGERGEGRGERGEGGGGRREGGGGRREGGGRERQREWERRKMGFEPTTLYTLDKTLYQLSYQGSSAGHAQILRRIVHVHLMNMYMLECVDYIPHWEF